MQFTPNQASPLKVFVSYAHEDQELRNALAKHLRILQREGAITSWCDQDIAVGRDRQSEIIHQLRTANIVLLLISPDFIASDHCWNLMNEAMRCHRDGNAVVVPVILRPCLWQKLPCSNLQCWPTDGKPIVEWTTHDHGFRDVAEKLSASAATISQARPQVAPSPKGPVFHAPHRRNPNFIGRSPLLQEIRDRFTSGRPQSMVQAITGMGGIGKTQLAVQYADRFCDTYDLVWWIDAEQPASIKHEYGGLSVRLGIATQDLPIEEQERATRSWLESHDNWLLIFDNAPGPDEIINYIPKIQRGHILITSRERAWRKLAYPVALSTLSRNDSIDLLVAATGQLDRTGADLVANTLGDLPLALVQASAYMDTEGISFADYATLFETRRKELWAREENHAPQDHYHTVLTTITICIERAKERAPQARDLLSLCAFLSPTRIPKFLPTKASRLSRNARVVPLSFGCIAKDPIAFGVTYAALGRYGLLETSEHFFSIHRLTQAVVRDQLTAGETNLWLNLVIDLLQVSLPEEQEDPANWDLYYLLAPHCHTVAQRASEVSLISPRLVAALNWTGIFWKTIGAHVLAEACFRQSCSMVDSDTGFLEPIDISSTLGNMSGVLIDTERPREALPYVEKALKNSSSFVDEIDPNLGTHLTNYAVVLASIGEQGRVHEIIERATHTLTEKLESEDPRLAAHLNSFAGIYARLENFSEAERYYTMAAELQLKAYGETRPFAAVPLMNLARIIFRSGRIEESEMIAQRAHRIARQFFPEEHPWVEHCLETLEMIQVEKNKV